MKYIVLTGRFLYSLIFLFTIVNHFSPTAISVASSMGIPAPEYLVPLSGVFAVAGALSIMIGYKARWGAWLLVAFLVPVTIVMHPFWKETEMFQMEMQLAMFTKNVSLLGAAFIISYFGAGPMSFDEDNKMHVERFKHSRRATRFANSIGSVEFTRESLRKYT